MIAKAFIVGEEEKTVRFNRTTHGGAKLILFERFYFGREIVSRVQCIVSEELVYGTVRVVAAGASRRSSSIRVCPIFGGAVFVRMRNSEMASTGIFSANPPSIRFVLRHPAKVIPSGRCPFTA